MKFNRLCDTLIKYQGELRAKRPSHEWFLKTVPLIYVERVRQAHVPGALFYKRIIYATTSKALGRVYNSTPLAVKL